MTEPPGLIGRWVAGARPRTLGAAVVPVAVGMAGAGSVTPWRVVGVLTVALGLQVGANYANDAFDAARGVDTSARVGPTRLVASGLASPRAVLASALVSFAVAGVAGLLLALAVDLRLLWVGAAALIAALAYSGGPKPYAGLGLGEVFVLAFFGFVATCGTAYVMAEEIAAGCWWAGGSVGLLAVGILMANNIRDIPTDAASGKRTLAVRLGDRSARRVFVAVVALAMVLPTIGFAVGHLPTLVLVTLGAVPIAAVPLMGITKAVGPELVHVLQATALLHLQFGGVLAVTLWLS